MLSLPEPMRVNSNTIMRCRHEIESMRKRRLRELLLPIIRLRYGMLELGEGFHWGTPLSIPRQSIRVGRYAYIGAHAEFEGGVVIGDLTMISTRVRIVGDDHKFGVVGGATRLEFNHQERITIFESDCWIGSGVVVKAGVTIGRGSVVGAGSFVSKSVPPYSIVGGLPAKLIKMRFAGDQIADHEKALYSDAM